MTGQLSEMNSAAIPSENLQVLGGAEKDLPAAAEWIYQIRSDQ